MIYSQIFYRSLPGFKTLGAVVLAGALLFSGCAAKQTPASADNAVNAANVSEMEKYMKTPVIRIDGIEFTRENIESAISNLIPRSSMHGSISDEKYKKLKQQAITTLYENTIIYNHSESKGSISATDDEIGAELGRVKKNLPEGSTLEKVLEDNHTSLKQFTDIISKNIVTKKLKKAKSEELRATGDSTVNEDFLKAYYEKNLDKFVKPDQILLSEILIRVDPSGGEAALDAGYAKIKEIQKLIESGKKFADLAKKYSQDMYAKNGGNMDWSHRDSLLEDISNVANTLKKGETSKPIRTIYGYHLIKLEDVKPMTQLKFSEINKEKLREDLLKKEYQRLYQDWITQLGKKAKVEILQDEYKGYINQ